MPQLAVLAASFSILSYEVLLTRVFSITQWNHLSFMVISVAMLGMGGAGVYREVRHSSSPGHISSLTGSLTVLSVSMVLSFAITRTVGIDYFQLFLDSRQALLLVLLFLVLAVPFFAGGLVIASAYTERPKSSHRIYLASMTGSALGALFPLVSIPLIGLRGSLAFSIATPLLYPVARAFRERRLTMAGASLLGVTAVVVVTLLPANAVNANPYKSLSHFLQTPGLVHRERRDTARGRFDFVQGDKLHYAPGLSLSYGGVPSVESVILRDGDSRHFFYRREPVFTTSTTSYAAYLVPENLNRILVLQTHGGSALLTALNSDAALIDLVVDHPVLVRAYRDHYPSSRLRVVHKAHRIYLESTDALYDLVHLDEVGSALAGMTALDQSHTTTIEGLQAMQRRLAGDGILVLTRRASYPLNDFRRLVTTAWRSHDSESPWRSTAILRSWDSFVIILSRSPLSAPAIGRVRRFAKDMSFDLVWLPGMTPTEANRYTLLEEPSYHRTVRELIADSQGRQSENPAAGREETAVFDTRPVSDDRPFPGHFVPWRSLPRLVRALGPGATAGLLGGEAVVLVVFAVVLVLGAVLLALPRLLAGVSMQGGAALYFAALGAGFITVEIGWIKTATRIMGNPTVGLSITLLLLLAAAGCGARIAERTSRGNTGLAIALVAGLGILVFLVLRFAGGFTGRRDLGSVIFLISGITTMGLLMGLPFPAGMRHLASGPADRAGGWAANGVAAVLASVLSAQVALRAGISSLFLIGACSYLLALLAWRKEEGLWG